MFIIKKSKLKRNKIVYICVFSDEFTKHVYFLLAALLKLEITQFKTHYQSHSYFIMKFLLT